MSKTERRCLDFLGFPYHYVDEDGVVWSCDPTKHGGRWRRMKLHDWSRKNRYLSVCLTHKGKENTLAVHRLVLLAFVGPCPKGMVACHKDDNRRNNKRSNLRWDFSIENSRDMVRNGNSPKGEKNPKAKLNSDLVRQIREKYASGKYVQTQLALEYGVGQDQISSIVRRETWKHVL